MSLAFAGFSIGCVDFRMKFRMRIISLGFTIGRWNAVVAIGQRPAWRLGCFALTDVRYQLLFVRV